jgi:hypothetical protein
MIGRSAGAFCDGGGGSADRGTGACRGRAAPLMGSLVVWPSGEGVGQWMTGPKDYSREEEWS